MDKLKIFLLESNELGQFTKNIIKKLLCLNSVLSSEWKKKLFFDIFVDKLKVSKFLSA